MSRPLRIEFPGAVYHVTSRGDRREPIYRDDLDRAAQLNVIAEALERFDARLLAYCLMGNHYHLVLQTRRANLSRLMRHINGVYTQAFNRRHGLVGHLFQGRFKAILVDQDNYLVALCRYVERNPVAAGLVERAQDWAWSSCRAHLGLVNVPPWLDRGSLYTQLLGLDDVSTPAQLQQAATRYAELVDTALPADADFWQGQLRGQIFLGDDGFVARSRSQTTATQRQSPDIPKAQRQALFNLHDCIAAGTERNTAMQLACRDHGMTLTAIAAELGLSVSRVSRVIRQLEAKDKT